MDSFKNDNIMHWASLLKIKNFNELCIPFIMCIFICFQINVVVSWKLLLKLWPRIDSIFRIIWNTHQTKTRLCYSQKSYIKSYCSITLLVLSRWKTKKKKRNQWNLQTSLWLKICIVDKGCCYKDAFIEFLSQLAHGG